MMQVQDLNLKRDILPLFDYTIGDYAAEVLLQVLQTVPDTVEEVYGRQNILKSFISNWQVIGSYTYQRLDAREVYVFLNDIATRRLVVEQNKFKAAFQLFMSEEERHRLRSRSVQTILLLHKLQTTYFQRLNVKAYPEQFRKQLEAINSFLQQLNLTANAHLIRENKFSLSAVTSFCKTLSSLSENEVSTFWKNMAYFEAYWSISKGVVDNKLCFPSFADELFTVEDFYHPILEKPVKNSLQLTSQQNVVLLTGPNMSGKSTLLRSVGLCVYLAHVGFGVPASSCTLPFFHTIAIIINANDNLRSGYSHFMSEIQNLKM